MRKPNPRQGQPGHIGFKRRYTVLAPDGKAVKNTDNLASAQWSADTLNGIGSGGYIIVDHQGAQS
jgi:hypothetical protein